MAAVEVRQRVAMAALLRHSSACSRAVSADSSEIVLLLDGDLLCALEMLFSDAEARRTSRATVPEVLVDLAGREVVLRLR